VFKINIVSTNQIHDSSAAFFENGSLKFASEEERYIGKKHVNFDWPRNALADALNDKRIDAAAYGWKLDKFLFKRKTDRYSTYPSNIFSVSKRHPFMDILPMPVNNILSSRYFTWQFKKKMKKCQANRNFIRKPAHVFSHHLSHAASGYYSSGFKKANILIMDGSGERESTSLFIGNGNEIDRFKSIHSYNSLGTFYSVVTYMLGMGWDGEGKTMGLAPYGQIDPKLLKMVNTTPTSYDVMMNRVKNLRNYVRYTDTITQKHKNLAATSQALLEKAAESLLDEIYDHTGYRNLVIGGGVGLNCSMNGKLALLEQNKNTYVSSAPGDNGVVIGAGQLAYKALEEFRPEKLDHAYFGPEFNDEEVKKVISGLGIKKYEKTQSPSVDAAEDIASGNIIGWFQGKMEFGPRALGNRSILAKPGSAVIRDRVNDIKHREKWRPLAPSVLRKDMKKYFEISHDSPFMSFTFPVKESRYKELQGVTHVDGTARLQTVEEFTNKTYYDLIKEYGKISGIPVILNTSFNDRGQPIVRTPLDAISSFLRMNLDKLYIGNYIISK
jgi:carbamoyltransferase